MTSAELVRRRRTQPRVDVEALRRNLDAPRGRRTVTAGEGPLETSTAILLGTLDPSVLPDQPLHSAITLAELYVGPR